MHIHILGICGTFMGGVAVLAKEAGHTVSGSDLNVYPPMSTQLEAMGIHLSEGYLPEHITDDVDQVVIGNVMSRGNPIVEHVLNSGIPYSSGPEWLADNVLSNRWVLAVAGTHGKTSTASMLAWILEYAGMNPGFLIGGVPANFGVSARYGDFPFFVVEADEYDTAFFDKRSKFVHYSPRSLILNNLEFDHADIFDDIEDIKRQFHHLVRTVPGEGLIITNSDEQHLADVLNMGCWTPTETFAAVDGQWRTEEVREEGKSFDVSFEGDVLGTVRWQLHGEHNRSNLLAAIAAARHAGVPVATACEAMASFRGIKRRLEVRGDAGGVRVFDDFAHHPTAITETLRAVREVSGDDRVIAVLEPRSNTMRMGVHKEAMMDALSAADEVLLYQPDGLDWDLDSTVEQSGRQADVYRDIERIIERIVSTRQEGDKVVIMSNGGFGSIHERLLSALEEAA